MKVGLLSLTCSQHPNPICRVRRHCNWLIFWRSWLRSRTYAVSGRHTRIAMKTRIWRSITARLLIAWTCLPASASASEPPKSCDSNAEGLLGCVSQVWKEWPAVTMEKIESLFATTFAKTPINLRPSSSYFVLAAESADLDIRAVHSSSDAAVLPKLQSLVVGPKKVTPAKALCANRETIRTTFGRPSSMFWHPAPRYSSPQEKREWEMQRNSIDTALGYQYSSNPSGPKRNVLAIMFGNAGCATSFEVYSFP